MNSSNTPDFDSVRHKRSEREGYNLIAERYRDAAPSRLRLTAALLDAAALDSGLELLDLASGPGVLAQAALARMGAGRVVISDIAERPLALARAQAPELLGVAADAEALPFAAERFDRVLCGLGLMFFPDERRALAEIRRVLRPQGRLALSVWASAEQVPLVECALACLRRLLPPPKISRPGPCRLGNSLPQLLSACSFTAIELGECVLDFDFADAATYWRAFTDLAGGAAAGLSKLPPALAARLPAEVEQELAPYRQGTGYHLSSKVIVASARKG